MQLNIEEITQKQRTFVAIQYKKHLVSQNIYLFKSHTSYNSWHVTLTL